MLFVLSIEIPTKKEGGNRALDGKHFTNVECTKIKFF